MVERKGDTKVMGNRCSPALAGQRQLGNICLVAGSCEGKGRNTRWELLRIFDNPDIEKYFKKVLFRLTNKK